MFHIFKDKDRLSIDEALLVWSAALESGYVCSALWVDWAYAEILRLASPPFWLLELSSTHTGDEALTVIQQHGCSQLPQDIWNRINYTGLYLGFLYLRFERGELKMEELLYLSGQTADRARCELDCEAFYLLLNEIDGGGPIVPSDRPLLERVAELYAPMVERVRNCLSMLPAIALA